MRFSAPTGLAALAADDDLPVPRVDIAAPRVVGVVAVTRQFRQAHPGRPEHGDHGGVSALLERPARAGALQPGQVIAVEDRDGLVRDVRRSQPAHRVGNLVLGGEPLEELLQRAELVAGVRGAVPLQQPHHPPLHILPADLPPAGPADLQQAGGGEPLHRPGIGPDRLGGLALGGQVQPERAVGCPWPVARSDRNRASPAWLGRPRRRRRTRRDAGTGTRARSRGRSSP